MRNWKRYSIEFLSIFIAVISAFALNNWNDNRKDRHAENKILSEIHLGLQKDLADLNLNASGHRMGIRAVGYFRNILASKPVKTDSFRYHYITLTQDFISLQNTSGYEALKSKGFELIRNDSLRNHIISLYEYDYSLLRKLEEEMDEYQFRKNYFKEITRVLSPNFEFDDNKNLIAIHIPLDISEEDEKNLLMYLWKIEFDRTVALHYYDSVREKLEKVIREIEVELKE